MDKKIVFIGGINGTGKTTVAEELSRKTGYPFFEGSSELMKELGLKAGDYDLLRKIPEREKKLALERMFERISKLPEHDRIIVTGHFVKIVNGKVTKYKGPWLSFCAYLIHISSNPNIISERITKDEEVGKKLRKLNKNNSEISFLDSAQIKSIQSFQKSVKKYCSIGVEVENNGDLKNIVDNICSQVKF